MFIEKNKTYRIKGKSKYFKDKYGTSNPEIVIECTDIEAWGKSWVQMDGNPTALIYDMRSGFENIPFVGSVYYGKVYQGQMGLGELVHEKELEEVKE